MNLADSSRLAFYLGEMTVPIAGVVMVVAGLIQLTRSRRPPGPAGYPVSAPWAPPGYPPAGYPPAYQPPRRPKRRGTTLLIVGSVILGLTVLEAASRVGRDSNHNPSPASGLQIGQCITADDAAHDQIRATDCGNPDAVYLVAAQSEGTTCPDGRQAGHSSYAAIHDRSRVVCLAPNLAQGRCYIDDTAEKLVEPTACSDARATFKVVKRIPGSVDATACGPDAKPNPYPVPPMLYCFGPPDS